MICNLGLGDRHTPVSPARVLTQLCPLQAGGRQHKLLLISIIFGDLVEHLNKVLNLNILFI